jgi:regulator of protease activity HflC (stomatin/prohibitin superfamily)
MSISKIQTTGWHVDVLEWQRAVVLEKGAVVRTVGAGHHRRHRHESWFVLDVRQRRLVVPPQDVLTADGLQVRASLFLKYEISDPALWLTAATDVEGELHALAQLRLREAVAAITLDELIAGRQALLDAALAPTVQAAAALGVTLESLEVRDLTLPQELRHAFAETALARETGKARLEQARGEAAALRSLANTAELMEKHPALIQLRALSAAESSGAQFIVKVSPTTPKP